ncbi:choice-of-anchor L domain-containing protein, partial [Winogradskyella sp.]|uniref:choice-of-anchor L domain-containing protein n=1 Tax=Winogradskyella sp. TaxID=1883156 RepID=UPI0025F4485B
MKKIFYAIALVLSFIGYSQDVVMENGVFNRCAPDRLLDSGGEFGNYGDNENFTTTICPQNVDDFIILEFTQFVTQLNVDFLVIYDGDDTTAPVLGTFSGPVPIGTISASDTNVSGCLTLEFTSDGSGSGPGWIANILCASPCQDIVASIDGTVPEPNGSGVVVVTPGENIDFSGSATFSQDGTGASYEWNFGDFNTATGENVSHSYATAGTYNVTLIVEDTNPQGCTGLANITVIVLGPFIEVDQSTYTDVQLIEDVLVNSPCASVSNVISSTGSDFGSTNGIGYFVSDGINFNFTEGILLTTGDAENAEGPEQGTLSDGNGAWPGDTDLENAIGLTPGITNNASFIQFDFVPLADNISFNYIFASEEYGTFQCSFTDAFAFLLTNNNTGVTENIAIVPGTTDVVSVLNVRDQAHNGGCNSVNPEFFDVFYGATGQPPANAPIDFRGYTTRMAATSAVVPNDSYTIKLVIADDQDTAFDAAVFLEAGSFDLGGDLGDDITIAAGTAECGGESITLDTGVTTANHVWYFEGTEIPGETSSTITITQGGTYSVDVVFTGVCQTSDSILVEFRPSPQLNPVPDLIGCSATGIADFDLSLNDDDVLGVQDPLDFVISYHLSEQDAIDNIGALPTTYTNTVNPQEIWVRLADNSQTCFITNSFFLSASTQPTINTVPDLELCDDLSEDGIEEFDLSLQSLGVLGPQSDVNYNVTYHLSATDAQSGVGALPLLFSNTVNPQEIFVRIESVTDANCFSASAVPEFNLVVLPLDDASFTMDNIECNAAEAQITGLNGGTFVLNPDPMDGTVIDPVTGEVSNAVPNTVYTVEYTTAGVCPTSETFSFTTLPPDDSTFSIVPTCEGGFVDMVVTPGGIFSFNPDPMDGVV